MSFSRHISRNFNANKTNRIRYDEDDFTCEIFRFDKTYQMNYTPYNENVKTSNAVSDTFNGFSCYRSKNNKKYTISFTYNAKEKSNNYRLELIYGNTHKKTKTSKQDSTLKCTADIKINGELVKNSMVMMGTDVNFSRNYQYCTLEKGENTIQYTLSSNTIFIGLAVKKYDKWVAKRHNNKDDKLTMIKATVEHTEEFCINTMTCEFMYHHELDELLEPTNRNANRSGLVFDYRDEINLYVRDVNGTNQRVFGGYISTVEVDDDLTKVTMQCADRLIDLDRRYCLSEVYLKGYNAKDNMDYTGNVDYLKHYNNYTDALKFLINNCEIYPRTNVRVGSPLQKRNNRKLVTYKKSGYNKLTPRNMDVTLNKGSITLRNGADTLKQQSCVIYDSSLANQTVLLNSYPNLYFHYGLGEEKWDEHIEETSTVTTLGSTKASETWIKRANSITSAVGNDAIKPIWKYVSHFHQDPKSDFFQSASKTWSSKNGNCCCKTECMLNLLNAKGITDLKYVHIKRGESGHIYARVNGFDVDPSTTIESRGWHNHITYPKGATIRKITDFPNKPF